MTVPYSGNPLYILLDFHRLFVRIFQTFWNSALLTEAKQVVPEFLQNLEPDQPEDALFKEGGDKGCTYCGGLGHRITECPKLESVQRLKTNAKKDLLAPGAQDY